MGQQEVRDQHRLRRAEVRVGRHQRIARRLEPAESAPRSHRATACCRAGIRRRRYRRRSSETCSLRDRPVCRRFPVSPSSATSRRSTKLCTSSSSPSTNEGFARPCSRMSDERRLNGRRLVRREHAGSGKRSRPRQAAGDIVLEQPSIEAERRSPLEGCRIRRLIKTTRPQSCHQCCAEEGTVRSAGVVRRQLDQFGQGVEYSPLKSRRRTCPFTCACSRGKIGVERNAQRREPARTLDERTYTQQWPTRRTAPVRARSRRASQIADGRRAGARPPAPRTAAPASACDRRREWRRACPGSRQVRSAGATTSLSAVGTPRSNEMSTIAGSSGHAS